MCGKTETRTIFSVFFLFSSEMQKWIMGDFKTVVLLSHNAINLEQTG